MKTIRRMIVPALLLFAAPLLAQEADQKDQQWTKALKVLAQRAALHDAIQHVRGDSGKWQDQAQLIHAPPIARKSAKMSLDEWADQLLEQPLQVTSNDDNWLLLRSRQLDDNDRVWVERIERQGRQFTILVSDAVWQGKYVKNFTYYTVVGINLGKLAPGKYDAKCVIQPMVFQRLDGPAQQKDSWPEDQRRTEKKPVELRVTWNVSPGGDRASKSARAALLTAPFLSSIE